ncbi:hypothetical protein ACHAWX_005078 [Stephanocyclus meneghinianus]
MKFVVAIRSKAVFSPLSAPSLKHPFTAFSNRATTRPNPTIPFGIIAALTKDNVIGINGALPWKHLPQDKAHFVNGTRDKILILGRKSFAEEDPTGENVRHARACVILSRNMDRDDLSAWKRRRPTGPELRLARSFEDALRVAQELSMTEGADAESSYRSQQCESTLSGGEGDIDCWVAGGEGIYREALRHGNLREVRLTFVDRNIDLNMHRFQMNNRVAFFPLDDFHRIGFDQVSKSVDGSCTFCVFKRKE